MSVIRLTAKIDANATAFHSTVKTVEAAATRLGSRIGAQMRTAMLYFIGFSGLMRFTRSVSELIDNWDELKDKAKAFGIEMDDSVISKAKEARAQFEALKMSLTATSVPLFTSILNGIQTTVAGLIVFKNMWGGFAREFSKSSPGQPFNIFYRGIRGVAGMYGGEKRGLMEAYDYILKMQGITSIPGASKTASGQAGRAAQEAAPKMFAESLAKIGGFTGRAAEEMKSIQFRQLSTLERIQTNTEPLKGGVR